MSLRPLRFPLAALPLLAAFSVAAQEPAERLLVLDQDAHDISATNAGALFNLRLSDPTTTAPAVEIAADQGAGAFQFLSGLTISPVDGRAYVTDLRVSGGGTIYAVTGGTGALEVLSTDPLLVDPFATTVLPDGRLVIVDWDSDPAGLGADDFGGAGHGALLVLDPATCVRPCGVSVLSDGTLHSIPGLVGPAFQDPVGVAYDAVTDSLYVADLSADPLGTGSFGALFRVDVVTGRVEVAASSPPPPAFGFLALTGVAVRPDGTPLIVDSVQSDSVIWAVDTSNPDLENNVTFLSGGLQYGLIESVTVDAEDNVYLVDSGIFDTMSGTFIVPPAVFRVDETTAGLDPSNNGVVVHDSIELVTPIAVAAVNVPVPRSVSPDTIGAATTVRIDGEGLVPTFPISFGPNLIVSDVRRAPGSAPGEALTLTLTPVGGVAIVPPGCPGTVDSDLIVSHRFGSTRTLDDAVVVGDTGGIVPGPPCSSRGDANCDGLVDGLDLALLGRHYAAAYCDGLSFFNNADFDDNGLIDGLDLAELASHFGQRP